MRCFQVQFVRVWLCDAKIARIGSKGDAVATFCAFHESLASFAPALVDPAKGAV